MHTALTIDGNGRWTERRCLPRVPPAAGHSRGAEAARRVVEQAAGLGITTLTMSAISSDNWTRPRAALLRSIGKTEGTTQHGARLHLRMAVDYSGHHYISSGEVGPDVDLLVRTGGEQRLWPDYISAGHGLVSRTQPEIRRFGTI